MCHFEGKILRKTIACGICEILNESERLYTLIRNVKRTDIINTTHTCIKVFRLCYLAVSCMSSLIGAHIAHTLDLVIILLSFKYGLYAQKIRYRILNE